jgi:hypothetical protein
VGALDYPFSQKQLERGYQVESIHVRHVAVRAVLFGHHFGKYLSAQASYMRPVKYTIYENVTRPGVGAALQVGPVSHTVWMHYGSATLLARAPVTPRLSVYGEGGLGISNRTGFEAGGAFVVKHAHVNSLLLGGGVEYRWTDTVDVVGGAAYFTSSARHQQPYTIFGSMGLRYNMRPLPAERVRETIDAGFLFPRNLVQVGYSTNAFGYRLNNVVSKQVPIFWGGDVQVERSLVNAQYQRNLFHTKKVFSIDIGASVGVWRSRKTQEDFRTFSFFPLARFHLLRTAPADLYFAYAVAGPTFISRDIIDGLDTGSRFTFQDFMGLGVFLGRSKRLNLELNLNHYSNGNIVADNAGVKIPLAVKVGYAF